jgi:hypothetical protein
VLWGTFVGYLRALVFAGLGYAALQLLGVFARNGTFGDPQVFLGWPFERAGAWSLAANVAATAAVVTLVAGCITGSVARRVERPVSLRRVAVIVLVTGYVPLVAFPGLLGLPWLGGLLATGALVRWLALVASPPLGRVVALLLALGLLVTISYGVFHPLWFVTRIVWDPDEGVYAFSVRNDGFAPVTMLGVDRGPVVAGAREGVLTPAPFDTTRPLREVRLGWGRSADVTLLLRCPPGVDGVPGVTRARLRYRVLGLGFTAPVRLDPPARVRCS